MKYIWGIIIVAVVWILGSSVYTQVTKEEGIAKSSRIECQKLSTTFERVVQPNKVKLIQSAISAADIKINMSIEKAKYMETKLFEFVDIEQIQKQVQIKIDSYKNSDKKIGNDIVLDILIYENDKKDPGKKTKKSKLYAGYLVFDFKVDKSTVYKIQIDFMDDKGADIDQKISCAIDSIMSIKG